MSFKSRFVDEEEHWQSIQGCPLARLQGANESACAGCRYNVCFPKKATVGCHMRTPPDVVARAKQAMGALATELDRLRALGPVTAENAAPWTKLGEALIVVDDEAAKEVGSLILRFVRATSLGPVEILR